MRAWSVLFVAASGCGAGGPPAAPPARDAGAPDPAADAAPVAPDAPPAAPDAAPVVEYDCAPEPGAGHQVVTCDDGVRYDVEVSDACAAGGCGIVLDIHGFTMDADQQDTHTRMRALAPPRGYLVVQPTSPEFPPSWAGGGYDDAVWTFVQATADRFDADRDRIHVTGFSQGGEMTLRLLCDHADQIASVAPAAGRACFDDREPAVAVPILYMHGTADVLMSYAAVAETLRDDVIATWALEPDGVVEQGDAYLAERWTAEDRAVLEFWSHDFETEAFYLGGHCLPGPVTGDTYRCRDDGQFDHSEQLLRFFAEHPRE